MRIRTPVFIYLRKLLAYMCFSFEYSASVCLFFLIDVTRTRCKCPPVFVYLCKLLVDMCFHFEYYYLFFTYYNRCQQKQVQAPTCICLFMQNCLLTCAFALNINISVYLWQFMSTQTGDLFLFLDISSKTEQGIDFNIIYW